MAAIMTLILQFIYFKLNQFVGYSSIVDRKFIDMFI
jgi:hypothetical protein